LGFRALLYGLVAAAVGGFGSIAGALLGGIFVGLVQYAGIWILPTQWQDTIAFTILVLFLVLRPQGILGKPLRKTTV
jgi:branched-chain amino acid transport system permease protein